jgi:hypothetical protein
MQEIYAEQAILEHTRTHIQGLARLHQGNASAPQNLNPPEAPPQLDDAPPPKSIDVPAPIEAPTTPPIPPVSHTLSETERPMALPEVWVNEPYVLVPIAPKTLDRIKPVLASWDNRTTSARAEWLRFYAPQLSTESVQFWVEQDPRQLESHPFTQHYLNPRNHPKPMEAPPRLTPKLLPENR